jgi:hypothetical protein
MFITMTKALTSAALLAAAISDPGAANRPLLSLVIFAGAIVVSVQAMRLNEYVWGVGFLMLALLFNPLLMISLSHAVERWLDLVCLVTFLFSFVVLRATPLPPVPSITRSNHEGSCSV